MLAEILNFQGAKPILDMGSLSNLFIGNAIVPVAGGGTNKSEYELLTGNSMELMNTSSIDPFNIFSMKNSNSLVSVLKQNGYQTLAAHSEVGTNYSRSTAYPDMGFDFVHFREDFEVEYYGDRQYATDESLYKQLIKWYENMNDQPRFLYLLTIQNHGDWNLNDEIYDTVHIRQDFGEYTDKINEYLSCISLSDQAFRYLTSYYKNVDRPVIICMVGDHAPSFSLDIVDAKYSDMEKAERLRKVPLLIWSNYQTLDMNFETISMNYIPSTLLDFAGIENMSYYYRYMNEIKETIPIISAYDAYIDASGNIYRYTDISPYQEQINQYLFMEYNNIKGNRRQELFDTQ